MIPNIRDADSCRNCAHARVEVSNLWTSFEVIMVWCKKEEELNHPEGGSVQVMEWLVCDWYQRRAP